MSGPQRARGHTAGIVVALCAALAASTAGSAPTLTAVDATTYQTEHCLFVIDAALIPLSPSAAYDYLYNPLAASNPSFANLKPHFTKLTTLFPANYFSICYMANTGYSPVPNYIDQIYKATGISTGTGSAGIGNGDPAAAQSFSTVDFCRYNLSGYVFTPMLAVYDHELGHAWGAQFFNNVSGSGPGILSNGHWLSNTTIDCQLGASYSADGGVTINKIYGDPAKGFRYQRVDNLRSNDEQTFSEQMLYLIGLRDKFPTTYALNSPVYNSDRTMGSGAVETYDHPAALARYGPRNPDYRTAPKQFKLGFIYIARDIAEVNAVYAAVEQSVNQFCNGENIDPVNYRFQTPFLVDTRYRASVDARLADLDGIATPTLSVTDTYVATADGNATINFVAGNPGSSAPMVTLVPASTQCTVVGSTVQISALPDGVHFFTLKAANAAGKRAWGHFVVEVQRAVTSTAIAVQPLTQTVVAGSVATFDVSASGTGGYTYQWYRQPVRSSTWNRLTDDSSITGSGSAALAVTASTAMGGDQFLCMVTNATGEATSGAAMLVVEETSPVLTGQPFDATVAAGNAAHFSVTAAGAPLTYGYSYFQWQRKPAGSGMWSDLADLAGSFSGATTSNLSIAGTAIAMTGDEYRCVVTNTSGATTSATATLTVAQAPAITTHPSGSTVNVGQTATFTVVASGSAPLSYQWQKYSTVLPGATGATLTLPNVQGSDAGSYGAVVTNSVGVAYSNFASLTVNTTAPSISVHPQSQDVTAGGFATFSVTATGSAPLTYQWTFNGANLPGATNATYAIASVQPSDAGNYAVTVTNSAGSAISGTAVLTVNAVPPVITVQPQPLTIQPGATGSFTVTVAGTPPFSYQWLKNGSAISGATAATLTLANVSAADAGNYSVTITNSATSVTSNPVALVVTAVITAPVITVPPQSSSVIVETDVSFSVGVSGTAPFTFQWSRNGTAISGAIAATYSITGVQFTDAGSYTVVVTNSAGSAASGAAVLSVSAVAPAITVPPQSAAAAAGGSAAFMCTVTGTAPLTFQWLKDGVPLSGATNSSLSLAAVAAGDAGIYTVIVTNSAGSATSLGATLTVVAPGTNPTTLLANLSVRTTLAFGQKLIPGFVTNGAKSLLLRAAGPTLTGLGLGLSGYPDPVLQVFNSSSQLIDQNDNWPPSLSGVFAQVGAFAFIDARDAALIASLAGLNSAIATGSGSGAVLLELYDTQTGDYTRRLVNVSARNFVGTGADALIVGFVITGSGSKRLLIRGIGPALGNYGVNGFLIDPYLELFDSAGVRIAASDDWNSALASTFAQVGAFTLTPNSKDAALVVTLPPGVYSAKLTGTGNSTGEGLVEVYEIWP